MFSNSYNKFFPTPKFLSMPSFGLDISDDSLKFVEIINKKHGVRMGKHGEKKISAGIIDGASPL